MNRGNGHAPASENRGNFQREDANPIAPFIQFQYSREQIGELITELEVPFHSSLIEWRVTHTTKATGTLRGEIVPYADPRAYTDRLNALVTPAGWTRRYSVHTSGNFHRDSDAQVVSKVFVTCDLTIHGVGSHSATGEEWTDNVNACTAAEAQAFKRACSCFGLGRYLYFFSGIWVDLDERKRVIKKPVLTDWATPEGWRKGLRPQAEATPLSDSCGEGNSDTESEADRPRSNSVKRHELIRAIEAIAEPLGRGLYRGILKDVARVWNPREIHELAVLEKVLAHMQAARRGLSRLEAVLEQTGLEVLTLTLRSMNLSSLSEVRNLRTLQQIVGRLQERSGH